MDSAESQQLKKNYFWNTLGSLMTSLSSALLLIVVTRTLGAELGGIFSLAFAVGQQYQILGAFEMRPYQATDIKGRFRFGTYLGSRCITCLAMLLAICCYALWTYGFSYEAGLAFSVAGLRFFDAAEDVFHGMFQQKGRLDIAGRALFLRSLISTVVFTAALVIIKNLMATCIITAVVSLAALIWLNIPAARNFGSIRPSFDLKPLGLLFVACLPLFLGSFLQSDLINVPRYGIAGTLNNTDQTIYAIIYMPALVINLLVGFAFKPLLTSLAEMLELRKLDEFLHLLLKCVGIIAGVSVLGEIAAYFIGIPILSMLYGVNLDAYLPALLTIILGGAFNALSVILYYSLVTMRSQILVVICYLGADLLAHGISGWLIASYQLMGAVFTYDLSMALLCVLFLTAFFYSFKRQK